MIAEGRPERRLQPVVRRLAVWGRQMLVEGTPQSVDPADRTIETYLTRIGPTLVEGFGSSALVDLDDVELEEAYLAAILAGASNRSQAAAAILRFHQCAELHYPMPEVDMSEVMSYLRCGQQSVDAELILPQERAEILARSAALADTGSQGSLSGVTAASVAVTYLPRHSGLRLSTDPGRLRVVITAAPSSDKTVPVRAGA